MSHNFISEPDKAMEWIIGLAEKGHQEIYCLEVIEGKDVEKTFDSGCRNRTAEVQGLFICPTLQQAIAIAKDAFTRKCGVVCYLRKPKNVKDEWQFPGKVFDLGAQRDYYFYEEEIRKLLTR